MAVPVIQVATEKDHAAILDVITLAFSGDPMCRWCWPNPRTYMEYFPQFTRAFGGTAFTHSSAYFVEGYGGAALWIPPNVHPDQAALGEIVARSVPPGMQAELFAVIEQMEHSHPQEPHWFLPQIGVDPGCQRQGYGAALLQHALERCDREKKAAYLDSTNPRNVSLYQRHGFEVIREIQVGSSPVVRPMLRKPR